MTNALHRAAVLLVVLLMHFCSPTEALNALAPTEPARSVAYADGPRHQLDVYAPRAAAKPAPVIVFIYGGGFLEGSRDWYRFAAATLAKRGILVAVPDYRLHPAVRFPAFVEDAAQAVAWVKANIAQYGGDPHRLFLMGHSAGAQSAALLALDPRYLAAVDLSPRDICGLIGLAGPYDYTPADPSAYAAIFGPPDQWAASRPVTFATAAAPPALLLTGRADSVVPPGNTVRLAAALAAAGVPVETGVYPGITHAAIMAALSETLAFLAPVRERTLRFVADHKACDRPPPPR